MFLFSVQVKIELGVKSKFDFEYGVVSFQQVKCHFERA